MAPATVTVSVEWLEKNQARDDLVVVDGSWHLPDQNRDPWAEYQAEHIPGALFFDLDKHSDQTTNLPHMMPSADQFGKDMGALGISETDTIVVYDAAGLFSAARVWWMFRQFGVNDVFVLDGGLPAWKKAGFAVSNIIKEREKTQFNAELSDGMVVDLAFMRQVVGRNHGPLLLDARGPGRFYGREPEPRAGMRAGHMPGAVNLPYATLLDDEKKLLAPDTLAEVIAKTGFDPSKPTIATCGSGVTASIILLALARLGHGNVPLYDGSWSEWGALQDTPIETD